MLSSEDLKALLTRHGQAHLLRFWAEIGPAGQARLAAELAAIDWDQMDVWIQEYVVALRAVTVPASVAVPPCGATIHP